jgi:chaperonin GroEL
MIEQAFGPPKVTKNSVTVARAIEFKDVFRNMGAQFVIGVTQTTNDIAGDGTTTLLCRDLYAESLRVLSAGMNPTELRKGITLVINAAELKLLSKPVTTQDEIAQVAMISANGDAAIGAMLADTFKEVGKDRIITLQMGKTFEHKLEVVKGLRSER